MPPPPRPLRTSPGSDGDPCARLAHLDLHINRIEEQGARALAGSRHLGNLVILDLSGNNLTDEGVRALHEWLCAAAAASEVVR